MARYQRQIPRRTLNSPFIHSGHFYSAPSSPLLLRGAPDYSMDTVSEFHAEAHCTAWMYYRAHGYVNSMSNLIIKHRHGLVTDCRLFRWFRWLRLSHNRPQLWVLPMYRSSSSWKADALWNTAVIYCIWLRVKLLEFLSIKNNEKTRKIDKNRVNTWNHAWQFVRRPSQLSKRVVLRTVTLKTHQPKCFSYLVLKFTQPLSLLDLC